MYKLSDQIERKFVDVIELDDEWEILTDTGWEPMTHINKTIEYVVYRMELEDGYFIEGADTHIVFDENMNEIFMVDAAEDITSIMTDSGPKKVISIQNLGYSENMYDVSLNSENHRFYSNGILSHNTTTAAGYILWYAMFNSDSTTLVAAHKYTGSQEIMQRIRFAYESCPNHIRAGVVKYNQGSLDFDNGSRIISQTTTETTGRGLSISLLYADEFSYVRPTIASEFWTSIYPTLSTGGRAIITSTPNSDEDQFSDLWRGATKCIDEFGNPTDIGANGFKAFKALWTEHPDKDEKWEKENRIILGEERFEREMNLEFIVDAETLIAPLKLKNMVGTDPITRQGQIRWYKKPQTGCTYVVALDPAVGTGGDYATIQVVELPSLIQVAEWQHNKTPVEKQIELLSTITKELCAVAGDDKVYYSVENNTLGEAHLVVIREVGEENIKGYFLSEPKQKGQSRMYRKGYNTTNKKKLAACTKIKNLIERDRLVIHSKNLISELKNFIASGASYAAKIGETDDLVMAMLLCVSMIQNLQSFDPKIDMAMRDHYEDEFEIPLGFFIGTSPFSF